MTFEPVDIPTFSKVAVSADRRRYAQSAPFHPPAQLPEYPFGPDALARTANDAYPGVRDCLQLLGLDAENYGTKNWNPLGRLIRPGSTVVLKPNFIRHFRQSHPDPGDCLITHGSVIRAALDYVYIALRNTGRIIIADAPQNDADFHVIRQLAGLDEIRDFYRRSADIDIEIYDLRPEAAAKVDGVITGHTKLPGDPAGYVKVDLARSSAFDEISHLCHLLYGSEYDTDQLRRHHHHGVHEYLVSRTILQADCVINLPKLKTHKKTGLTAAMKNLVGINGDKNWLPHHRLGPPTTGGDQFADDRLKTRIERQTMAAFRRIFPLLGPLRPAVARPLKAVGARVFGDTDVDTVRSGNWHGNDTTWRMVLDINRILLYADADGKLAHSPRRNTLSIVDAIVAGQGNGPLDATPADSALVLASPNPVAADLLCAAVMGFDCSRLPMLARAMEPHPLPVADFQYEDVFSISDQQRFDGPLTNLDVGMEFKPHFGWTGHIEHRPAEQAPCHPPDTAPQGQHR